MQCGARIPRDLGRSPERAKAQGEGRLGHLRAWSLEGGEGDKLFIQRKLLARHLL